MGRFRPDQRVVVAVVYVCSMLLNSLSATIINVALATLGREFHVSPAAIEAVVVSFLVSQAVCIPVSGWLGDRWGTKRSFLLALALFVGASAALCGVSRKFRAVGLVQDRAGAGAGC
ncbi:MAG: MFS transporter [Thermomicrobiales bacterium]